MRTRIKSINDNGTVRVVKKSANGIWRECGVKVTTSGSMGSIRRAIRRQMNCDRRSYDLARAAVC